jgi:hypothetical protein
MSIIMILRRQSTPVTPIQKRIILRMRKCVRVSINKPSIRVQGSGFIVQDSRFRVQGSGFSPAAGQKNGLSNRKRN